jgi:hypothetical protein
MDYRIDIPEPGGHRRGVAAPTPELSPLEEAGEVLQHPVERIQHQILTDMAAENTAEAIGDTVALIRCVRFFGESPDDR